MSPRGRRMLGLGLGLACLLFVRGEALANACELDGWLGTQVSLRPADLPGELGWEAGVLPVGMPVSGAGCLRIGPGIKLSYADGFHTALVARLSLGDGFFSRQLYLQGGPVLGDSRHGFDVEAGMDWGFAAVFVAADRFDKHGESSASLFTVGVRFSFATAAGFFTMLLLHPPT
jgi:hypothetical protein